MIFTKKKSLVYSVIAILVALVVGLYFIGADSQNNQPLTRTAVLEKGAVDYQNYLTEFDDYSVSSENDVASFNGAMDFKEEFVSPFDNVSLEDNLSEGETRIVYNCYFDIDNMQFVFTVKLVDLESSVIATDTMVTDAIVTENGGLDAEIEIDGKIHLMSDYMNEEVLDDCFWWVFVKVVAIIVVVYVIVSETAEQIRGRQNYTYNKQLESSGNGVAKGNYITKQIEDSERGFVSANYRFGFTTFPKVGCGVASLYNLMVNLGRAEMLSETILSVELLAIEFSVGWGSLGSNPLEY